MLASLRKQGGSGEGAPSPEWCALRTLGAGRGAADAAPESPALKRRSEPTRRVGASAFAPIALWRDKLAWWVKVGKRLFAGSGSVCSACGHPRNGGLHTRQRTPATLPFSGVS